MKIWHLSVSGNKIAYNASLFAFKSINSLFFVYFFIFLLLLPFTVNKVYSTSPRRHGRGVCAGCVYCL